MSHILWGEMEKIIGLVGSFVHFNGIAKWRMGERALHVGHVVRWCVSNIKTKTYHRIWPFYGCFSIQTVFLLQNFANSNGIGSLNRDRQQWQYHEELVKAHTRLPLHVRVCVCAKACTYQTYTQSTFWHDATTINAVLRKHATDTEREDEAAFFVCI